MLPDTSHNGPCWIVVLAMACSPLLFTNVAVAASTANSPQSAQAACTFDDGKQLSIWYPRAPATEKKLPFGKIWTPAGSPMILFTNTALLLGNSQVPVGAYSMFAIPAKNDWTLIVNRDVTPGAKYDEHQDVARAPMEIGALEQPQPTSISFSHSAPGQCNMRIYRGSVGTWIEFKEKVNTTSRLTNPY